MIDLALTSFVTLFVIIDPVGLAPIFVALTQGMEPRSRRAVALRATGIAAVILLIFGLAGESLLNAVGITMPAFRIAGGLLLFLTALDMLFERRTERRGSQVESTPDPSVFPLAIPLVAGPGAMATIILLIGNHPGDMGAQLLIFGVMFAVVAAALGFFLLAGPIERALGKTGITVVTRLLGMLLAALSVQFVIDGLNDIGMLD
ncbi:MAG: MarC family protein [Pseudomonadota bacterium]